MVDEQYEIFLGNIYQSSTGHHFEIESTVETLMNELDMDTDLFLISNSCNVLIIESRDKLERVRRLRAGPVWVAPSSHHTTVLISHYTHLTSQGQPL